MTHNQLEDAHRPMACIPDRPWVGGKCLGNDGYVVLARLLDADSGG